MSDVDGCRRPKDGWMVGLVAVAVVVDVVVVVDYGIIYLLCMYLDVEGGS